MTLSSLALLLIRRWYVALLGLVMTGALAGGAFQLVKPDYEAAASILLLPPANPGANPYLDLAAVPGVPEVISRVLQDSKYADKYEESGIKDYEVTPDQSAGGPAVLVVGRGKTEDGALSAMLIVRDDVLPVLQELQDEAGVDGPNLITGRQIYVETEATKVGKKQTRAVIAAVGAGLVLTLFLVVALDALLSRLAGRRARRRHQVAEGGLPEDVPPPAKDESPSTGLPVADVEPDPEPEPEPAPEPEPEPGPVSDAASVRQGAARRTSKRSSKRSPKRATGKRPANRPARAQQPGIGDRR